jgi:hypothetical protein
MSCPDELRVDASVRNGQAIRNRVLERSTSNFGGSVAVV